MEQVILLDENGVRSGTQEKALVHTDSTPLHLGFSCYLFDDQGALLITRRSLGKATWPGVWTNSFCGHPKPGEQKVEAVRRRGHQELGVEVKAVRMISQDFRYRSVDASGIVENEICPVFTAVADSPLTPNPEEVMQWEWVHPGDLRIAADAAPFAFSPWMIEQLPLVWDART